MKKCKKNYTNIILFLTFMLLWKYYIQAQRMEAIVVERMKFMIQHIYIIIAQMKIGASTLTGSWARVPIGMGPGTQSPGPRQVPNQCRVGNKNKTQPNLT